MKKFISLLIALVLLVSMFALPAFALAEETTPDTPETGDGEETAREPLTIDVAEFIKQFEELVINNNKGLYVEMSKEFKLNQEWINDEEKVHALFGDDIIYRVLPKEDSEVEDTDENKFTVTYKAGGEGAKADQTDVKETFLKTKHVTLKAKTTFEAAEGFVFAGWKTTVTYKGETSQDGDVLYRAGEQFAMPAANVEVVAQWLPKAEEGADQEEPDYTYDVNDKICLEYCTPTDDPRDENWKRVAANSEITLETSGWWMFRYVVVDGTKDISDNDAVLIHYNTGDFRETLLDEENNVYLWEKVSLKRYAVDTSNPEIALSSSMKTKMDNGLTAGTGYSVPTSLDITDSSDTTVTYTVWRHSGNGAKKASDEGWVQIYDSAADDKVLEGGENYITASGTINPLTSDETADGYYRYKIVYSVRDNNGYFGVDKNKLGENGIIDESGEFHPVLLLGVKLSDAGAKEKARMEAWKIVLFVIAGLSAVGIVVLLVIKPKQEVAGDSRVSSVSDADAKASDTADTSSDSPNDAE